MKDPRVEKLKSRSHEHKASAPQRWNNAETFDQVWKEKKKKEKLERRNQERQSQDTIPVTGVNATHTLGSYSSGGGGRSKRS